MRVDSDAVVIISLHSSPCWATNGCDFRADSLLNTQKTAVSSRLLDSLVDVQTVFNYLRAMDQINCLCVFALMLMMPSNSISTCDMKLLCDLQLDVAGPLRASVICMGEKTGSNISDNILNDDFKSLAGEKLSSLATVDQLSTLQDLMCKDWQNVTRALNKVAGTLLQRNTTEYLVYADCELRETDRIRYDELCVKNDTRMYNSYRKDAECLTQLITSMPRMPDCPLIRQIARQPERLLEAFCVSQDTFLDISSHLRRLLALDHHRQYSECQISLLLRDAAQ